MDPLALPYRATPDGVSIQVRVKPRASKSKVLGIREGFLEVSLAAAPVDGKANAALCRLLADELGVAVRAIHIVRGEQSPKKHVQIEGLSLAALQTYLSQST